MTTNHRNDKGLDALPTPAIPWEIRNKPKLPMEETPGGGGLVCRQRRVWAWEVFAACFNSLYPYSLK